MPRRLLPAVVFALTAATPTFGVADHPHAGPTSQDKRAIKSLTGEDIAELRGGGGWGLAKAAELNGIPGPAHLLELKDEIALTPQQVAELIRLRDATKRKAIALGERLIALEQELDEQFANRVVTDASLKALLSMIAAVRRDLRYTH